MEQISRRDDRPCRMGRLLSKYLLDALFQHIARFDTQECLYDLPLVIEDNAGGMPGHIIFSRKLLTFGQIIFDIDELHAIAIFLIKPIHDGALAFAEPSAICGKEDKRGLAGLCIAGWCAGCSDRHGGASGEQYHQHDKDKLTHTLLPPAPMYLPYQST